MRHRLIQKEMVFYKLYKSFKADPEKYVNVWEFVGEIHIEELGRWELMSYTAVHRAFEIYDENPGLIQRQKVRGRSGARYYQYRIAPNPQPELILDEVLQKFYRKIKR